MLLCLDVGNTHVLGGVFNQDQLKVRFRYSTHLIGTADQFGIFLMNVLQFHHLSASQVSAISVCSVVPSYDYTIKHAISLYFEKINYFVLKAGDYSGLHIRYQNPNEVGADRIANAIGAIDAYPNKNLIIIDMGTATTLCAVTENEDYLGGAILPGIRLNMESLRTNTAKLVEVDIETPKSYVGNTTRESIQAGLYYGQLGSLREIVEGMKKEVFPNKSVLTIGTGGFSQLYRDKKLFDHLMPDLVLQGLRKAYTTMLSS